MVRTQLYLPEEDYKFAKKEAKKHNISFAGYVRLLIDKAQVDGKKEKTLHEKYPFIGMFKGDAKGLDNDEIDKTVYGL